MNTKSDPFDRHFGPSMDRTSPIRFVDPRKETPKPGDRHKMVDTLKEHMAKYLIPRDQIVSLHNPTSDDVFFECQVNGGGAVVWVRVDVPAGETVEMPVDFAREAITVRNGYVVAGCAPQLRIVGRRYELSPALERAVEADKTAKLAEVAEKEKLAARGKSVSK